jgi:hypothetical protein
MQSTYKYKDKEWLYEQYILLKKSTAQIGEEINCGSETIRYWLNKYNIPVRNRTEARKYAKKPNTTRGPSSEETKRKISNSLKRRWQDNEFYCSHINDIRGHHNVPHSVETRQKISDNSRALWNDPIYREKALKAQKEKIITSTHREHINEGMNNFWSDVKSGKRSFSMWKGGISYEPYCPKFNYNFKEHIREKFGRVCFICGKPESTEFRKLSVHHIDYNKNSICNGKEWSFVPLCQHCHVVSNYNRWFWFNLLINYWLQCDEIYINNSICGDI